MIRVSLFLLLIASCLSASGQSVKQPFFKLKADSLQYVRIQQLFYKWSEDNYGSYIGMPQRHNYDSLHKAQEDVLNKAVWRWVYKPKAGFTSFADLKAGTVKPEEVTHLSISSLKAYQIPDEVLLCKNLEELELVNTSIDKIQATLNRLPKLKVLYLFNNVPSGRLILEQNEQISYLRIAGHNPEKLPASYKNFSGLDSLNLNRNQTSKFPNIKQNKKLTKLLLVENELTLKRFKGSASLTHLDLTANKVTVVPNKIHRKFKSLEALSFNMNKVKKVKRGLGKMPKLEYLSFYANGITEIPKPVYQLKKLEVIDLFNNRIEFLSPEIKNLQKLRVLYLANNRLYRLPDEIGLMKSLEEVYVYNNRMDTLPASMNNLENLRVLWVNDNFFHTIPATTWRVKNLDYLDASQNFIKRVPDEITQASKLAVLILSGTLMNKERDNPALFQKLRQQGTRIIYYTQGEF